MEINYLPSISTPSSLCRWKQSVLESLDNSRLQAGELISCLASQPFASRNDLTNSPFFSPLGSSNFPSSIAPDQLQSGRIDVTHSSESAIARSGKAAAAVSSSQSVHLYSMEISKRLRPSSSLGSELSHRTSSTSSPYESPIHNSKAALGSWRHALSSKRTLNTPSSYYSTSHSSVHQSRSSLSGTQNHVQSLESALANYEAGNFSC